MSRSDTRSNIIQYQDNKFIKTQTGPLKFNNNGIAIIYKHGAIEKIIPIFFAIKNRYDIYNTFLEKQIIYKSPFVLFKPQDSLNQYNDKWFIFHYYLNTYFDYNDDDNTIVNYTQYEFENMTVNII